MDKLKLYTHMADRKSKPKDYEPYKGDNGRVNKAVKLYKSGKLKTGGIHIDVGGAIGDLGFALREAGLFEKTLVIDIAAKNLEAARAKGNYVVQADVDRDGFRFDDPNQFGGPQGFSENDFLMNSPSRVDAIAALDFIEHIIDPEGFAKNCFYFLKPGGQVFVNTPNIRYWKHIVELLIGGTFPHTSGDTEVFHGGHLAFFTYKDLQTIFGRAGFTKFEMVKDEEGYTSPPDFIMKNFQPKTQADYMQLCMELGCPNLLFIAEKP